MVLTYLSASHYGNIIFFTSYQGAWFTNEFIAFEISRVLKNYKNSLIGVSGLFLLLAAFGIYHLYKLDPIDAKLIVNEQAINLTSQHTDSFKTYIHLDDFIERMKSSKFYMDRLLSK